jgi:metal transporter CNNM
MACPALAPVDGSALAVAARVMPLVQRHHLLLVTLLMANALAMEALPLFLDRVLPSWAAVLLSVTAVLFFGEYVTTLADDAP